jgi:hypothetical protein
MLTELPRGLFDHNPLLKSVYVELSVSLPLDLLSAVSSNPITRLSSQIFNAGFSGQFEFVKR